MKRKLLVLLGISVISVNAFGVTTFAESAEATETTEEGDAAEDTQAAEESEAAEGD